MVYKNNIEYKGSTEAISGLDGLRPSHLRDLIGPKVGEAGAVLRRALTKLVNFLIRGDVPQFIRGSIFGAGLCALEKDNNDVRPIAVGTTYRRLAVKTALRPLTDELGASLTPIQLGFGCRGGCEAAVHAARTFHSQLSPDEVIVKLDIKNAFNSLQRHQMLEAIRSRIPTMYQLLRSSYLRPTPLFFQDIEISSESGIQQGDPAGPAIFSLTVDAISRLVRSPLNLWYLDDITLGGTVDLVLRDLENIIPPLRELGLKLNMTKCEVIATESENRDSIIDRISRVIPTVKTPGCEDVTLLGAPLTREAARKVMERKMDDGRCYTM